MKEINKKKTGYRITDLMIENNFTVEEVADKLDVSSVTIFSWRNGKKMPSVNHFLQLSELLGVTIDDIIITKEGVIR